MDGGISDVSQGMLDKMMSSSELKVRSARPAGLLCLLPSLGPITSRHDIEMRAQHNPHSLGCMSLHCRARARAAAATLAERARPPPPFELSLTSVPAPASTAALPLRDSVLARRLTSSSTSGALATSSLSLFSSASACVFWRPARLKASASIDGAADGAEDLDEDAVGGGGEPSSSEPYAARRDVILSKGEKEGGWDGGGR